MGRLHRAGRMVSRGVAALVAGASCVALCGAAPIVERDTVGRGRALQPAVNPDDITGRDFSGLRQPLGATRGPIWFRAARAWAWTESSYVRGPGLQTAPVQRLLLSGDVRVHLGAHEFSAQRAVVWLQRLDEAGNKASGGRGAYQVFVYFDHVGTAAADATIALSAERLPVRGIIDPDEKPSLMADLKTEGRPADPLLLEGEGVLAATLRRMVERPASGRAELPAPPPRPGAADQPMLEVGKSEAPEGAATEAEIRELLSKLPPSASGEPIFAKGGVLSIRPGASAVWTRVSGTDENAAVIEGGLVVEYDDLRAGKSLQITGERAVVFVAARPEPMALGRMKVEDVRGIYLEGDVVVVASGGRYTLRGPRVFYDLRNQRAIVADAVFWTYDQQRRLPLYLRASTIRQEADRQFTAESATLANTAFFEPDFAIGATSLTIAAVPRPVEGTGPLDERPDRTSYLVDARNITLRAGGLPFFYFPRFRGYPDQVPLKDFRVESAYGSGTAVKTTWNAYGLLGLEKPQSVGADLLVDYYFDRGVALGGRTNWDTLDSSGQLFAYGLPHDAGTDRLSPGTKIERDTARGIFLGEHRLRVDPQWTIFLEGSYISDETFVDAFLRPLGETRREFTNRAYLRRLEENTALAAEVKGTFNDFLANEYLLQSPGYVVDKLPEASYVRIGDDLLPGLAPGLVSYFSEYRVGVMRLSFDEPTAAQHGYFPDSLAQRALGINAGQSVGDRLRAEGYTEDRVTRLDTRHELAMPLELGPAKVTPFAVGRATLYDNAFDRFSPQEADHTRLWGGAGLHLTTTLQHVDDGVDSQLLHLHRVRHILEPHATLWYAGTNVDRVDLPVYDRGVEGLAEGTLANFGLSQTLQTQRGGPGRWHSVDVVKFNTDFTLTSDDANPDSPIGRFVTYRPELSNVGNFVTNELAVQATNSMALTGSSIFDFDTQQQARSSGGVLVEHWPGFRSFMEVRNVHPDHALYFDFGGMYELTNKYTLAGGASYDLNNGGFQTVTLEIRRRFPGMIFGVGISYNNTTDQTSFGFVFQPQGIKGPGARLQGLGGGDGNRGGGFGG